MGRDGKWVTPAARELVPGDVIRVRMGDIVPADARLLEGDPVEVDQSALTGESPPATRKSGEAVRSFVRAKSAHSSMPRVRIATSARRRMVQGAQAVSHFQRAVLKIGNYLIILAMILVATIIAFAIFRGDPIMTTLQFALVLTVAAIPVAMPTVLSVTMAVGARLCVRWLVHNPGGCALRPSEPTSISRRKHQCPYERVVRERSSPTEANLLCFRLPCVETARPASVR